MALEGKWPKVKADGRPYYGTTHHLIIPGIITDSSTTQALSLNRCHYYPIFVRTPITIDQVVLEVTTAAAAGKKGRFGIYKADKNWQPTSLVVASAEIALDATAVVTTTLTTTKLEEGRYLMVINCEDTATFRATRYSGMPFTGFIATLGANLFGFLFYAAQAYAALPAAGLAWDTVSASTEGPKYMTFLRVATP